MELYENQQPYHPEAGPWPTQYSEEEIQKQRDAGQEALQRFQEAIAVGGRSLSFEFEPGVYRLSAPFVIEQVEGIEIVGAGAELIIETEDQNAHFRCSSLWT